ncbi:hypothetical protein BKK79_20120 [Cupriavidus sp. USMAA2-4]|nr:hypothetical protein BKK79_00125 [Cupriavidus sp. USMAA2-4]AOY93852.1 hypothetical protein BKK79_20120 [Cupriavidus sp. USMAA2-4]
MMMFVRMLAGKIYEAQLKINSPLVKDFLLKRCFPNMEEREKDRLKEFNREVTKCRWLAAARNGHAMHYPTFDYWRDSLEKFEESEIAFRYYFGRKIGDVLYETADLVAGNAFVLEADGSDWRAGVSTAIVDLERISGIVAEFIVTCVQGFERGVQDPRVEYKRRVKRKDVKRIDVPHIEDLMIPFFLDTKTKA